LHKQNWLKIKTSYFLSTITWLRGGGGLQPP